MALTKEFDVVVVGAGHAGIEAALSAARLGSRVLVITTNLKRIGYMSCNPAIGGLAKGHMVRELDALGGEMGMAADSSCIQFRRLNAKKGPAVRGSRSQCDKDLYSRYMSNILNNEHRIDLIEAEVKGLLLEKGTCRGVIVGDGSQVLSRCVVITAGTFMNAVMHVGREKTSGGRVGDKATSGLSDQLRAEGFQVHRLKTGTPPRLDANSIDFSLTEPQGGDEIFYPFSFRSHAQLALPQVECFLTHTNEETHDFIRKNLHLSPIYSGEIEGKGPRYCPSIEDKVVRFATKSRHQTFLEPEGINTNSIYLQGISTSLPAETQDQFVRSIPALRNVKFLKFGYAVEYDFLEPTQLKKTLETKGISGLFLAGQINGTSGYEEAAVQGFIGGVNASLMAQGKGEFTLGRHEAYIGVLIDDLVNKGTSEPYRMFTSRAEHRLHLREDNTWDRLRGQSIGLGVLSLKTTERLEALKSTREALKLRLQKKVIVPNGLTQEKITQLGSSPLLKPTSLASFLKRPEIKFDDLYHFDPGLSEFGVEARESAEIEIRYEGYIKKQMEILEMVNRRMEIVIPEDFDYSKIQGLKVEEKEKLSASKPRTLADAVRISGVNPSAIQILFIYLKAHKQNPTAKRSPPPSSEVLG
ncbi:MAG: tRNA uridine-5-carboxymethylaminomethyl(34) synthesis enzyme MnmG [Bdellovibrionales bacterium CG10_big_fil_rev_8_21_14_0_10_45_34]|nr:MAG: tRNA uridine-5-carboxymethylaminomethyl(34) synthesis enzyme MnmG [Bdellovibrionales bacterium CG10_big_fil_rev_8_21_14_0_10_45_34]